MEYEEQKKLNSNGNVDTIPVKVYDSLPLGYEERKKLNSNGNIEVIPVNIKEGSAGGGGVDLPTIGSGSTVDMNLTTDMEEGDFWLNSDTNTVWRFDGTSWVDSGVGLGVDLTKYQTPKITNELGEFAHSIVSEANLNNLPLGSTFLVTSAYIDLFSFGKYGWLLGDKTGFKVCLLWNHEGRMFIQKTSGTLTASGFNEIGKPTEQRISIEDEFYNDALYEGATLDTIIRDVVRDNSNKILKLSLNNAELNVYKAFREAFPEIPLGGHLTIDTYSSVYEGAIITFKCGNQVKINEDYYMATLLTDNFNGDVVDYVNDTLNIGDYVRHKKNVHTYYENTTVTSAITLSTSSTNITTINVLDDFKGRGFIAGDIQRTGGSANLGQILLEVVNGTTVISSRTYEVTRDLTTSFSLTTGKRKFFIPGTVTVRATYTGTGTVTVNNIEASIEG